MFGFLNTKERNSILPNSFKNEYYGEICFSVDTSTPPERFNIFFFLPFNLFEFPCF